MCLVRYDNETGKGDHRHVDGREMAYEFKSIEQLRRDFEEDVKATRPRAGRCSSGCVPLAPYR